MHGGTLAIEDHVYQESPRLAGTLVRVSLQRVFPARDKP
jgi:two-component system sensor histidine kinase TctE